LPLKYDFFDCTKTNSIKLKEHHHINTSSLKVIIYTKVHTLNAHYIPEDFSRYSTVD